MFAHRLLAVLGVWGAAGCKALSVTSCSILFLCCRASALRPPGLTLHCSSNNCCGTLNICEPTLLLTRPPLHWAHALCTDAAVCMCVCVCQCVYFSTACEAVCIILWRWSYLGQVVRNCVCMCVCTVCHCNRDFYVSHECKGKLIRKPECQLQWKTETRLNVMWVRMLHANFLRVHWYSSVAFTCPHTRAGPSW